MADAQSKAEKLAAARKKAEELKKKKAAGAKAKKDKAPADKKEDEPAAAAAAEAAEEKPKEEAQEDEAPPVEPSTPAEAEPTTTASPFAPTDTESPTRTGDVTSESTAELEAKLLELEKELDAVKGARDEAQLTADALEKKVVSLELLHKEDESQINRLQRDLAEAKNENVDLKNQLQKSEAEALRLSKQENQDRGGTDNDHLDELEDEERKKLEARIRQLEAENSELQRGIWQERRRDMQPPMDDGTGQFTTVPLSPSTARKQGGFGDFFTTGLNALTGGGGHEHQDDDGFLDDDEDFDEDAFRKAQEETAKARIERIKEVKRGLKNWEGWRLDLVEGRRGGGEGLGEIFEI